MSLNLPTQPARANDGLSPLPKKGKKALIVERETKRADLQAFKEKAAKKAGKKAGVAESLRKPIGARLRARILDRDGNCCTLCGVLGTPENPIQIGHITPVAQGGTNCDTNLRAECALCNVGGGARRRDTPKERIDGNKIVSQLAAIVLKKGRKGA